MTRSDDDIAGDRWHEREGWHSMGVGDSPTVSEPDMTEDEVRQSWADAAERGEVSRNVLAPDSPTVSEPRTQAGRALLAGFNARYGLLDAILAIEAEAAQPIDVPAMAETLRFLYHADQPCDKPDEHRHDHIAAGIVGQYPRIARLRASDTDHD